MGEKRGFTGKLKYPFDRVAVLEVNKNGSWYRVSENDFRSWDGERRLSYPIEVKKGFANTQVEIKTEIYEGPVYEYGTNTVIPKENRNTVVYFHENRLKGEPEFKISNRL